MFIEFQGWYPDLAPTTTGILVDGTQNVVPTNRGYRGANDWSEVAQQESLSADCTGLFYARRTTQANRLFAGTSTQIYERGSTSGTWTGRVPAAITVSAVSRWRFAQVGDITLAGSKDTQSLQFETTTATTIAAMPRYAIIDTVGEFVMIGNVVTSTTYTLVPAGEHPDRWWCSALGAYDSWAPSLATQAASGRLVDVPGPLTAGRQLGERFVFYKNRGIWVGQYDGLPFVWSWALLSQEIGTFGQECVVPVGQMHYFVGTDNFYVNDGAQVRPIGEGIREWFFSRLQKQHASKIIGVHDEYNSLLYWYYPGPTSTGGGLTEFVVYNYETNKWGNGVQSIHAASSFLVDQLTWDELWAGYTFDSIPNTTFDSAWFQAESFVPVFVNSNRKLATLFGPHMDSVLETSWAGDDTRTTLLRRMRARWITAPDAALLTPYRLMRQGEAGEAGTPRSMTYARWDFTQVARWHRVKVEAEGNWETGGIDAEVVARGRE
jgi:hypothetical protein